jgi:hypothetical protein
LGCEEHSDLDRLTLFEDTIDTIVNSILSIGKNNFTNNILFKIFHYLAFVKMSIDIIKQEITRFLKSDTPEVMAIKGSWGVGKTYSWNKFLVDAKNNNDIALRKYSYVSLFGLNSLDNFKYSIFEQIIGIDLIGNPPSIETFKKNTLSLVTSQGRQWFKPFVDVSPLKNFAPAIQSISFLSLTDTLICIDDLERKGSTLSIKDVLGLVSLLKEQKKCKIVLLLNDGEDGLDDYVKYSEKVIDIELHFAPTAKECASIAFDVTKPGIALLSEFTQKLDIRNIRVLKKIERLVQLVIPILQNFDHELVSQVVRSLTLFSWCYYCANDVKDIPPLDYVAKTDYTPWAITDEQLQNEEHAKWNQLLRNYTYHQTDELDLLLAELVRKGYFTEAEILNKAEERNEKIKASKSKNSFDKAWGIYYDSFDNNQDEVRDCLCDSFIENIEHINRRDLDNIVFVLRNLKEDEKASELIDLFINKRSANKEIFNPEASLIFDDLKDIEIIDKFKKFYLSNSVPPKIDKVLSNIIGRNGWTPQEEQVLAATSIDEYYDLFKSSSIKGENLSSHVNRCLQFGKYSNASDQQKKIASNAIEALKRIAGESDINRLRVKAYGVEISN